MHAWEAIQTAVDEIEAHLFEEMKTQDLADQVSLSSFYFQKLFKRLVGKSPQEYIQLPRLAKAAEALKQQDCKIVDLALEYGFSSHAHFTRAFKEAYGLTPSAYRQNQPRLNTLIKPEIALAYQHLDEDVPLLLDDFLMEIKRKTFNSAKTFIGVEAEVSIAGQIPMGESTGIDMPGELWTSFHHEKAKLSDYISPDYELGMSYQADPQKETFTYFAGAPLITACPKLSDFTTVTLPKGEYIVCKLEAETFEMLVTDILDKAGKYLFGTWLPAHQLHVDPFSAEKYSLIKDHGYQMEIWIKRLLK